MNITFLLGNGFDIGLGLKSGYRDFYSYFIEKANKDNVIKIEIEKDKKENYPNWSDLENALGKFSENVSMENVSKFIQDKIELDILLKQYLSKEEEKFTCDDKRIKEMINKVLEHIRSGNCVEEKERIQTILNSYLDESYFYQAITFNYTDCVDKIWKSVSKENVGVHSYRGDARAEKFEDVLHIHGTLKDNEMIIGVNDETQISNKELLKNENFQLTLIKPYLNKAIGQRKTEKAREIIDRSRIICLYGLSIGVTDNIWWEYIGEWLKGRNDTLLIIYNYDPEYVEGHAVRRLMYENQIKNAFLNNTKLNDSDKEKVKTRIIVYNNKNVFSME